MDNQLIPTFEAFKQQKDDEIDYHLSDNIDDVKKCLDDYFKNIMSDDSKVDFKSLKSNFSQMIISNSLWWSQDAIGDIDKLIKVITKQDFESGDWQRVSSNILSVIKDNYNRTDKDVQQVIKIINTAGLDDDDSAIINDPTLSTGQKVLKLKDKFQPSALARILNVSPQRVRNVIKSKIGK